MTFTEKTINATFTGSFISKGFIDTAVLLFKVPGCKREKALQYGHTNFNKGLDFIAKHKPGDKVKMVKIGSGVYAGYRLNGYEI